MLYIRNEQHIIFRQQKIVNIIKIVEIKTKGYYSTIISYKQKIKLLTCFYCDMILGMDYTESHEHYKLNSDNPCNLLLKEV